MTRVIESDVLVIGGGGAGTRAAIEARAYGAKVVLVVKGRYGLSAVRGSGATGYRGGARPMHLFSVPREIIVAKNKPGLYRRVPLSIEEEPEAYYRRAIQAGLGMANPSLTRILVDEARAAKTTLQRWGAVLDESPYIDSLIMPLPCLAAAVRCAGDIDIVQQVMITGVLVQDDICVGALGLHEVTGEPMVFKSRSTILATGGNAQMFKLNVHPSCVTGDGNAMGYEAGAELVNIEFGQVFITTVYPNTEAVPYPIWKLHPRVLNRNQEEFMHKYVPSGISLEECMDIKLAHGPFSCRDNSKYLEFALLKETLAGMANEHNGFYLEIGGYNPDDIGEAISWQREWMEYRGIDLTKPCIEINLSYHCSNGGLRIDENARTTLPGLYAVGELAAGPHGADRLGGAMMTFSQVFGARAGRHAAEQSADKKKPLDVKDYTVNAQLEKINKLKGRNGQKKPAELVKPLQESAWNNLMVVRSQESLKALIEQIQHIRRDMEHNLCVKSNSDLVAALELSNMLQVGEMIASVGLARTESRGSHYREDFPSRDDKNWLCSIRVKKVNADMKLDKIKLDPAWEDKPEGFDRLWWG